MPIHTLHTTLCFWYQLLGNVQLKHINSSAINTTIYYPDIYPIYGVYISPSKLFRGRNDVRMVIEHEYWSFIHTTYKNKFLATPLSKGKFKMAIQYVMLSCLIRRYSIWLYKIHVDMSHLSEFQRACQVVHQTQCIAWHSPSLSYRAQSCPTVGGLPDTWLG